MRSKPLVILGELDSFMSVVGFERQNNESSRCSAMAILNKIISDLSQSEGVV